MKLFGVDKDVVLLGIVSFLTDVSSEMVFSVFSIFFTVILGASAALLGLVEGLADFAASSLDYLSGFLSDRTGRRKPIAAFGYGFSTGAKVVLVFANTVVLASLFRVVERLGKSIRGAPRDSWLSSIAEKNQRGFVFGLHKTFDKLGAVIGPFIAYFVLSAYGQNAATFKLLFWIALVPAALAVLILIALKDRREKPKPKESIFTSWRGFGPGFKHYLRTAGIFSLAYFSFGFLLLKAYLVGFAIKDVVLLYALFNIAFVLFAVPIGKLGDRIGRKRIIAGEYVIYALMAIGFIFAATKLEVVLLFILFGIFYSIDESQSKAYIADLEASRRATAIGLYNFYTGLIYLPASIIAGLLWKLNPAYAFTFAAVISIMALAYFLVVGRRSNAQG